MSILKIFVKIQNFPTLSFPSVLLFITLREVFINKNLNHIM